MLMRVALAVDRAHGQEELSAALRRHDFLITALNKHSPLQLLGKEPCDFLIASESCLPFPAEQVAKLIDKIPEPPVLIILVDQEDEERRTILLASGCDAVLYAGLPRDRLCDALITILHKRSEKQKAVLHHNRRQLSDPRLSDFVSHSRTMQAFMNIARRVVRSDSSLLITGETGVGKERLALAIHAEGPRAGTPFIPINCAALPDALLESELFGHEQGAFTGATRTRRGAFEMAHRGTIFLDEVGDMPLHLQAKLLRVLQDRQFVKLGGERAIKVDVRVMAATNRDLAAEVEKGAFRRDLYYRLGVVTLMIPPLRDRCEDIPELAESYVAYLAPRIGVEERRIAADAMEAIAAYDWPGNVRELINVLERALLLCDGDEIALLHLPEEIAGITGGKRESGGGRPGGIQFPAELLQRPWREARQEWLARGEREYLESLLKLSRGKVNLAAQRAGMTTRALYDKMQQYDLRKETFKSAVVEIS